MAEHEKPFSAQANLSSWSLRDLPPVTMQGTWDGELPEFSEQPERKMVIQGETIRIFGIEWWLWRTSFQATATTSLNEYSDGMATVSMELKPTTRAAMVRAEWWRRAGFYLIARPVDWLADHTVRPFARWILSDEIDFSEDDE